MSVLAQILSFAQSMVGKSVLVYAFGWLFKLNPKFKDSGIPVATAVVNILVALIAAAAEASGAVANPAVYSAVAMVAPTAAAGGGMVETTIFDILLPQLIADGAYNWPRRLWAWLKERFKRD